MRVILRDEALLYLYDIRSHKADTTTSTTDAVCFPNYVMPKP